ncbi:MAG TPA: acetate kinase, partial [Chloroflexota bacterium]
MTGDSLYLLTLNTGSSSLKAAVYRVDETVQLEVKGTAERIGAPDSELSMTDAAGHKHIDRRGDLHSHGDALRACLDSLDDLGWSARLTGVGHRVV